MTFDIVITTDRSMMTDHHHHEFLGFMTTGPAFGVPERVWSWIAAPKPKVDSEGRPSSSRVPGLYDNGPCLRGSREGLGLDSSA